MITDGEIIQRFRDPENREETFGLLVRKYQERLYWHIRKIVLVHEDTDDVLQNTFVKVWKNLGSFRQESGLFTWIYRIATNEALTFLKQKQRRRIHGSEDLTEQLADNLEADVYFNGDEIQLKLQQAILTLPEKQRVVFNMRYFDEMKYEEMAEILSTSKGALKASYHHAVKKIEHFMKID